MDHSVEVYEDDAVATVVFRNEGKRNALNPPILHQITEAFRELADHDDIRCVILTGAGDKAFSSGRDLTYDSDGTDAEGSFAETCTTIREFDFPTIAMINGATYGGAMYLIAVCDLRIAVRKAKFAITPAKLGSVYPGRAINGIMGLIGPANVKQLLFTAESVDAERAYDMGLLNETVPREELESTTQQMAETIANNAPLSLQYMKDIVHAAMAQRNFSAAEREWATRLRNEAIESEDHAEGVRAFRENRSPDFDGS